ncbi:MAG: hypothetical protein ACRDSJ_18750 [Rubrobacteraceae bacterium]
MNAARAPKGVDRNTSGFSEALWLAKKDVRRAWMSYPASGLFMLALALLATPSVDGILFEMEGFGGSGRRVDEVFNAFFADYMFLIMGAILAVNTLSMDYMRVWSGDVFSHRLAFLRSLPASTKSLVASRMMSMLFAVPFTVPAFFVPIYLLSDLREMGFPYIWFAGIWLGWSLLYSGVTLLCELAMSGKVYVWFSIAFILGLVAILAVLEFTVEISLVERSANLALEHGPVPALASILAGGAAFALFARETKKRVERRELS